MEIDRQGGRWKRGERERERERERESDGLRKEGRRRWR